MKKLPVILFLSTLLFVSCTTKTIKVDNRYQLTVPTNFNRDKRPE
jgi:hypothetical protein